MGPEGTNIDFFRLVSFESVQTLAFYMLLKYILCREDHHRLCVFRIHNCGIRTQYKLHWRSRRSVIVHMIDSTQLRYHNDGTGYASFIIRSNNKIEL